MGRTPRRTKQSLPTILVTGPALLICQNAQSQCIREWTPGTSLPGLNAYVYVLRSFDDGSGSALFAGGAFTTAGGGSANRIAKWNGSNWSALGNGVDGSFVFVSALTDFDDGGGNALYVGGNFTSAGGASANNVAKWNGSSWSSLGAGFNSTVRALTVFDDGGGNALYAGGDFVTSGGSSVPYIAKWNGSSWESVGGGTSSNVSALTVFDDGGGLALFAAGGFQVAGTVNASRVAKWNGSTWSNLGAGTNDWVYAMRVFNDGSGLALFAGGAFTTAGTSAASRIAKWNGTSWSQPGTGVDDVVRALTIFDDGSGSALCAGGEFINAGGGSANRIAKWDGLSWSDMGGGMDGVVFALTTFDDGGGSNLYAGGDFMAAGANHSPYLAKWSCAASGVPTAYCTAKVNSLGCTPAIDWSGTPSATSPAPFIVSATNIIDNKFGILFYGTSGRLAFSGQCPWNSGGFLCVKSPLARTPVQNSGGFAWSCTGTFSINFNALIQSGQDAQLLLGTVVNGEYWYRDPQAPCNTGTTDAIEFTIEP